MPNKPANLKNTGGDPTGNVAQNQKRSKKTGMSKSRAGEITNAPGSPNRGGKTTGSDSSSSKGGTNAEEQGQEERQ